MKTGKVFSFTSMLLAATVMCSCGSSTPANAQTQNKTQTSSGKETAGAILGALFGGTQGNTTDDNSSDGGSLLGGIISKLTSSTSQKSIIGTWVYSEPTVQFESENLLAKAGGAAAGQTIVKKIKPYYEKIGIKSGVISYTFNEDNTCSYIIKGKEHKGTYEYDNETGMITIKGSLGFNLAAAYVTTSGNNLALTFDASKLLSAVQTMGATSTNTTVVALSGMAKSYKGMKTGFLFKKK